MGDTSVKYVAELAHVREVSMLGAADLGFWNAKLRDEDLMLAHKDGQAQILVVAAASKYLGLRFQEVSFSVLIDGFEGEQIAGAYLLQAYNSSRFFAFCERRLFCTPYEFANIRVECSPIAVVVITGGNTVFEAVTSEPNSSAAQGARLGWKGPVLLPKIRAKGGKRKLFFAKIQGHTRSRAFEHGADTLRLNASHGEDIIQDLISSGFAVREWAIREDASHAKSKTYTSDAATMAMAREFAT
jgi:hypothetical protein